MRRCPTGGPGPPWAADLRWEPRPSFGTGAVDTALPPRFGDKIGGVFFSGKHGPSWHGDMDVEVFMGLSFHLDNNQQMAVQVHHYVGVRYHTPTCTVALPRVGDLIRTSHFAAFTVT